MALPLSYSWMICGFSLTNCTCNKAARAIQYIMQCSIPGTSPSVSVVGDTYTDAQHAASWPQPVTMQKLHSSCRRPQALVAICWVLLSHGSADCCLDESYSCSRTCASWACVSFLAVRAWMICFFRSVDTRSSAAPCKHTSSSSKPLASDGCCYGHCKLLDALCICWCLLL
jgi:hypothetical protein